MTPLQIDRATAFGSCTLLPGSAQKRFALNMAHLAKHRPEVELTDKQAAYLEVMAWRFRRQMPQHLVPETNPQPPLYPVVRSS